MQREDTRDVQTLTCCPSFCHARAFLRLVPVTCSAQIAPLPSHLPSPRSGQSLERSPTLANNWLLGSTFVCTEKKLQPKELKAASPEKVPGPRLT